MTARTAYLVAVARRYLVDAANSKCSMHTRYSSAMNALGCLVTAGLAEERDQLSLDLWEGTRYDPEIELNIFHVKTILDRVDEPLRNHGLGR